MTDTPAPDADAPEGQLQPDIRTRLFNRLDSRREPPADTAALVHALGLDQTGVADEVDPRMVEDLLHMLTLQGVVVQRADGTWRRCNAQDVIGRVSMGKVGGYAVIVPTDRAKPLVRVGRRNLQDSRHGDLVHAMLMDVPAGQPAQPGDDDNPPGDDEGEEENGFLSRGRGRSHGKGARGRRREEPVETDDDDNGGPPDLAWARVIRVLERRPDQVIGIIDASGRYPQVRILQREAPKKLRITGDMPSGLNGAIVKVKIEKLRDGREHEAARILEILGSAFSPDDDELVAIAEAGLRMEYDPAAEAEAREVIRIQQREETVPHPGRQDLTHLQIITIDPDDAKDYDDAISMERHGDGSVTLGVHIADVSHYVTPGSALDAEAALRGCTVYLPRKTLHMLPLGLAGQVCSLSQGDRRFAKTVFIRYSADGKILEREMVRSEIINGARLTYTEAHDMLHDRLPAEQMARFRDWVPGVVKEIGGLAQMLFKQRRAAGSFQLQIPKPHLTVDEKGRFVKVEPEREDESHTIVEECMLAANRAVAHFLDEHGLPLVARVHPDPSPTDIDGFSAFLAELGFAIPGGEFTPTAVQKLLDDIADREGGTAVHLALLKSMQRAVYADHIDSHYALQFDHYLHFTSPIRRYPDTLVHQIIDTWLDLGREMKWTAKHGVSVKTKGLPEALQARFELATPVAAGHCTDRLIRADAAEQRVVKTRLLREIAARHLGKEIMATVTGGTRGGIFCQLDYWLIDGFLGRYGLACDRLETAGPFAWTASYGMASHTFRVGERLKVTIQKADPGLGELSLELAEAPWLGDAVSGGKRRGGRGRGGRRDDDGGGERGQHGRGRGRGGSGSSSASGRGPRHGRGKSGGGSGSGGGGKRGAKKGHRKGRRR